MTKLITVCVGALFLIAGHSALAQTTTPATTSEGVRLFRAGNYADSIVQLEQVVAANKKDYTAWAYLGASYLHADRSKEALKAFENARRRGPVYFTSTPNNSDGDQPVKLINPPRPDVTQHTQIPFSLRVTVAIEFLSDRTIGFVFPVNSLLKDQRDDAITIARWLKFTAAVEGGKPVTSVVLYDYDIRQPAGR